MLCSADTKVRFCKYGLHLPLNRQSQAYAREGVECRRSGELDGKKATAKREVLPPER
jgi:hypothetical protein